MSRFFFYVFLLSFLIVVAGLFVLAVWDVPVQQTIVEKEIDSSLLLENRI